MSLNDTGFEYQRNVSSNWANGEISRRDAIIIGQAATIAKLREKLAAAVEFRFGDVSITKAADDSYYVQRIDASGVMLRRGNVTTLDLAIAEAIRAGWLNAPPTAKGE